MTRLRMAIKPRGKITDRKARWHEKTRTSVMFRCEGRCEACRGNMKPLEWAHITGRGNVISEPWCSTPELTAALCSGKWDELGCHERLDRSLDPELKLKMRWQAYTRLAARYDMTVGFAFDDPLDAIREIVRKLEPAWVYDETTNSIVKL